MILQGPALDLNMIAWVYLAADYLAEPHRTTVLRFLLPRLSHRVVSARGRGSLMEFAERPRPTETFEDMPN